MDLFKEKIMRSVAKYDIYMALFSRIHRLRCLIVIFIASYVVVIGPDSNVEAAAKFIQDKFQYKT